MPVSTTTATIGDPAKGLTEALARVQAHLPAIVKGKTATVKTNAGGQYTYKFADLAAIQPLVLPLLAAEGLTWVTKPTMGESSMVLTYALTHVSGEAIEGVYPLPDPRTKTPQEIGSAITYARRYTLCSVVGIAPDEDEDGTVAVIGNREAQREEAAARNELSSARNRVLQAHIRVEPDISPEERNQKIKALLTERGYHSANVADLNDMASELELGLETTSAYRDHE